MPHPENILNALPNQAASTSHPQLILDALPGGANVTAALETGGALPLNVRDALANQGGFVLPDNIRDALPISDGPPLGSTGVPDRFHGPFGSAGVGLDWGTFVGGVPIVGPANEFEVLTSEPGTDSDFDRDSVFAPSGLGSSVLAMNLADPAAGALLIDPGVDTGFTLSFRARCVDDGTPRALRMFIQMDNASGPAVAGRIIGAPSNNDNSNTGISVFLYNITASFVDYVVTFTDAECALFDFTNQRFRISFLFSGGGFSFSTLWDFKNILLNVGT